MPCIGASKPTVSPKGAFAFKASRVATYADTRLYTSSSSISLWTTLPPIVANALKVPSSDTKFQSSPIIEFSWASSIVKGALPGDCI